MYSSGCMHFSIFKVDVGFTRAVLEMANQGQKHHFISYSFLTTEMTTSKHQQLVLLLCVKLRLQRHYQFF